MTFRGSASRYILFLFVLLIKLADRSWLKKISIWSLLLKCVNNHRGSFFSYSSLSKIIITFFICFRSAKTDLTVGSTSTMMTVLKTRRKTWTTILDEEGDRLHHTSCSTRYRRRHANCKLLYVINNSKRIKVKN